MGNILADSPCCNICNHSFTDTADFVNHVKLHFGGPGKTSSSKRKAADEMQPNAPAQKRHSPNRLTTTMVNNRQQEEMPKMVNSQHQRSPVNSNDQMITFASQEEAEEEFHLQQPGSQKKRGISPFPQSLHSLLPNTELEARRPSSGQSKSPPASGRQPPPPPSMAGSHPANLLELFTNQQILQQQQQHQHQQQQQLQAAAHFNSFNPFLPQYNPHQVKTFLGRQMFYDLF